jgi:hypothetical protein
MITGDWVSTTLTSNWQLMGLPSWSTVLQVTAVVPRGKTEPDGGLQLGAGGGSQLSENIGSGYSTIVPV